MHRREAEKVIGGMFMKLVRWIILARGKARVIDNDIVEHERKKKYEINRIDRFRYRTRYFTDSGIIGTKEFVSENYQRFKDVFMSKREKIPRRVAGLDGVYSLKRLAER